MFAFDDERAVANAGLVLASTLAGRLGIEQVIDETVDLGERPDAAHTRQNGRGVDLTRNFPWRWRPLDQPGGLHYAGPHPLSEPEARRAACLIKQVRPQLTIWFYQPLGVDDSGGHRALERRYARLVGLPLVRLPRYPGSAASWQNHLYPNTSFVVELPPRPLTHTQAARYEDGVLDLAG